MAMTAANKRQIEYWSKSAARDWETANFLFRGKRYDACLFYCHLALEKILKAHVTKTTQEVAPKIHSLLRLVELAKLDLTSEQKNLLSVADLFNIRGRYADDKFKFYQLATRKYAEGNMKKIKKIFEFLCQESKQRK